MQSTSTAIVDSGRVAAARARGERAHDSHVKAFGEPGLFRT